LFPYENARYQWQKRLYFWLNTLFSSKANPLLYVPWIKEFFVYQYLFILKQQ